MTNIQISLPRLHPAQQQILREARKFNVVCCGVRFGKSKLGIRIGADLLLKGYPVAWFSPTYKMMEEVWTEFKSRLMPIVTEKDEQQHRLVLATKGVMDFWSLDSADTPRGRKYKAALIDEASIVPKLKYAWENVILARLTDYGGDAWFFSTPKGMGYFYELYNMGANNADWASWRFPTSANPYIPKTSIETARKTMSDMAYRQEYLAEFIADGSYFTNVSACATIDAPDTPAAHDGHTIYMGVDWGISNDFTVATLLCPQCNRVVDWFSTTGGTFMQQRARVTEYAKRWSVVGILPERNSIGYPNIEILFDDGLPIMNGSDNRLGFYTTALNKAGLIERLKLALEKDGLLVPSEYAMELNAFEITARDGSPPKFSAPDGQHDDRVISLALSVQAALSASGYGLGVL